MPGPNIRRHQLGRTLAGYREAVGLSQKAAGALIARSQSFMAQVEGGTLGIRSTDLECLLRRYGVVDETRIAKLVELSEVAGQRGWASDYGLPDWLADYIGLEEAAATVRDAQVELLPGLLQLPCYARRVIAVRGRVAPETLDATVAARVQRQARLTARYNPLHLTAACSEAAVRRSLRQPEQLRHLVDRARLPNVDLRVVPLDAGPWPGMQCAFTLLDFPPGVLSPLAVQESTGAAGYVTDAPEEVAELATLFDLIIDPDQGQALDANDSLTLIEDLLARAEKGHHQ